MNKQEIEKAIEILRDFNKCVVAKADGAYETIDFVNAKELAISTLTQQLNNGWIPVSSGNLPKCEERVLICANRKRYDGKIVQIRTMAMYEDGTMHTDDSGFSWEDNDFEYDEEADDYIIPEGWYEQNVYCEEFGIVDDFVTHWQPLPPKYEEASE